MPDNEKLTFAPPCTGPEQPDSDGDFVFRFPIGASEPNEQGYADPLLELIRGQLADLLQAVVLTDHGRRVRVDGFRLLRDPDTQYDIFPDKHACGKEDAK